MRVSIIGWDKPLVVAVSRALALMVGVTVVESVSTLLLDVKFASDVVFCLALVVAAGLVISFKYYSRLLLGMLLVFMPFVAQAADTASADSGGMIAMIVSAIPSLVSIMPAWFGLLVGVLYAVAHLVAALPKRFTDSWPSWLKSLINLLAANYGKATNKDG